MPTYIVVTFSPVQGFIEKSRKLRDLYGSSLILSFLSYKIIQLCSYKQIEVISPGLINVQQGMPNRILLKIDLYLTPQDVEKLIEEIRISFINEWKTLLKTCRDWVEKNLESYYPKSQFSWKREWGMWGENTWEFFWGKGESIKEAMKNLENRKLERNWTGVNWIGESSSLTGTDAIAWYRLGAEDRNPKHIAWGDEKDNIEKFYHRLACILDGNNPDITEKTEGKYISSNERLSIPELVKRLITLKDDIAQPLNIELPDELKDKGFSDLTRRPQDNPYRKEGQWTGWFMGDGDKVGDYLNKLNTEQENTLFSETMREWGRWFQSDFKSKNMGRVVYAGGDDFLGVIYNSKFPDKQGKEHSVSLKQVLLWLKQLRKDWEKDKSKEINDHVTLSLGFILAAPSIPQRDILQHCREAERRSKSLGRDRVTIRFVFNNNQYVQWTTPWEYLSILDNCQDWNHLYSDLIHLKNRHAFCLGYPENSKEQLKKHKGSYIIESCDSFLNFLDQVHFNNHLKKTVNSHEARSKLFNTLKNPSNEDYSWSMIYWLEDLITMGWYLFQSV